MPGAARIHPKPISPDIQNINGINRQQSSCAAKQIQQTYRADNTARITCVFEYEPQPLTKTLKNRFLSFFIMMGCSVSYIIATNE
jgi:hypothetical protein